MYNENLIPNPNFGIVSNNLGNSADFLAKIQIYDKFAAEDINKKDNTFFGYVVSIQPNGISALSQDGLEIKFFHTYKIKFVDKKKQRLEHSRIMELVGNTFSNVIDEGFTFTRCTHCKDIK